MKSEAPEVYRSVSEFLQFHNLTPGKHTNWQLTTPAHGQVIGIPLSRGIMVAASEVLCYIERHDRSLFLGHKDWFVEDEDQPEVREHQPRTASRARRRRIIREYA